MVLIYANEKWGLLEIVGTKPAYMLAVMFHY